MNYLFKLFIHWVLSNVNIDHPQHTSEICKVSRRPNEDDIVLPHTTTPPPEETVDLLRNNRSVPIPKTNGHHSVPAATVPKNNKKDLEINFPNIKYSLVGTKPTPHWGNGGILHNNGNGYERENVNCVVKPNGILKNNLSKLYRPHHDRNQPNFSTELDTAC